MDRQIYRNFAPLIRPIKHTIKSQVNYKFPLSKNNQIRGNTNLLTYKTHPLARPCPWRNNPANRNANADRIPKFIRRLTLTTVKGATSNARHSTILFRTRLAGKEVFHRPPYTKLHPPRATALSCHNSERAIDASPWLVGELTKSDARAAARDVNTNKSWERESRFSGGCTRARTSSAPIRTMSWRSRPRRVQQQLWAHVLVPPRLNGEK